MSGLIFIESVSQEAVAATSDGMTLRFESDGATFAFRLSHHAAVRFEQHVRRNSYPLHCAPDGELVPLAPHRKRRERDRSDKRAEGAEIVKRAFASMGDGERS